MFYKEKIASINSLSDNEYFRVLNMLSDTRVKHINSFKNEDDRKRSILASKLLIDILNELGSINLYKTIEINEHGKPYFKSNQLFFSISHSDEFVVVVLADKPIGVDIQKMKDDFPILIKNKLHKNEIEFLNKNTNKEAFYEIWTKKESYLKCLGNGLSTSLSSFDVAKKVDDFTFVKSEIFKENYYLSVVVRNNL